MILGIPDTTIAYCGRKAELRPIAGELEVTDGPGLCGWGWTRLAIAHAPQHDCASAVGTSQGQAITADGKVVDTTLPALHGLDDLWHGFGACQAGLGDFAEHTEGHRLIAARRLCTFVEVHQQSSCPACRRITGDHGSNMMVDWFLQLTDGLLPLGIIQVGDVDE